MRLLDLFCCAGGCSVGYHRAGFTEIVGVDINPQPRYPFTFVQGDALEFVAEHGHKFDAIHASPPCQAHVKGLAAVNAVRGRMPRHADLIPQTRAAVEKTGKPYVIENVEGAPLENSVRLCGTAFGLPIRRHRLFESNMFLFGVRCEHGRFKDKKYYSSFGQRKSEPVKMNSTVVQIYGNPSNKAKSEWGPALGIGWMEWHELSQAIPPAYTQHLGRQVLDALRARAA
jgi:DNA (cytosine-5)-methyltransferase 1